jgi:hypothetical protein
MRNITCILKFLLLFTSTQLIAQDFSIQDHWWIPEGKVTSIVDDSLRNQIILAGNFSEVRSPKKYGVGVRRRDGRVLDYLPIPNKSLSCAISDQRGGWFIAGAFDAVGDSSRTRIAQINSCGEVTNFNIQVVGFVNSLFLKNDVLYFGGPFTAVNGQTRSGLASYDLENHVLLNWSPNLNGGVINDISAWNDTLIVAGNFSLINSQNRNACALFQISTGALLNWNPLVVGYVNTIKVDENDLFLGGVFTSAGGQVRRNLAKFDLITGALSPFSVYTTGFAYDIEVANNNLFVAGGFSVPPKGVFAVNKTTGAFKTFTTPVFSPTIRAIALMDSVLIVGGGLLDTATLLGKVVMLDTATGQETGFTFVLREGLSISDIQSIATNDSSFFLAGSFTRCDNPVYRSGLVALDKTSGRPTSFNPSLAISAIHEVKCMEVYQDDLLLGGNFIINQYLPNTRSYFASVSLTTSLLNPWQPQINGAVYDLLRVDTTLYIGGSFSTVNGLTKRSIAEFGLPSQNLKPLVTYFNTTGTRIVRKLLLQDSTLYFGGNFTFYITPFSQRNDFGAINVKTGTGISSVPIVQGTYVSDMALYHDTLILGGDFYSVNSASRSEIAAFNTQTNSLLSWNPGILGSVVSLTILDSSLFVQLEGSVPPQISNTVVNEVGVVNLNNLSLRNINFNISQNFVGLSNMVNVGVVDSSIYFFGEYSTINQYEMQNIAAFGKSKINCFQNDITVCHGDSFTWINGATYVPTRNGVLLYKPSATAGVFDSVFVLNLTSYDPIFGVDSISTCDSLTWIDGITYYSDTSNVHYTIANGSAIGCDSIVELNLAITKSALSVDARVSCDSLLWIDGLTYYSDTSNVFYYYAGGSFSGCDSLVELILDIRNTAYGIDSLVVCDSLTWIDGNTYYQDTSGISYRIPAGSVNGCDSIAFLDLTIYPEMNDSVFLNGVVFTAVQQGVQYQWVDCNSLLPIPGETNRTFTATANGNYAVLLFDSVCFELSDCVALTDFGMNENEHYISFSPNPSYDVVRIEWPNSLSIHAIEITDLTGRLLASYKPEQNGEFILRLPDQAGVYIVRFRSVHFTLAKRLVKQ